MVGKHYFLRFIKFLVYFAMVVLLEVNKNQPPGGGQPHRQQGTRYDRAGT